MARRRILTDVTPLRRFPQFKRLWSGQLVSVLGTQLTVVAVPYQLYRATHSSFDVGLLSLAQLGPLLAGSVIGGSIADAADRRRLLLVTQTLLAATSVGLAVNATLVHPAIWPLFVMTGLAAGLSGVDSPTRSAVFAGLVDRRSFASAAALNQMVFQVGGVVGPALAGILLGQFGLGPVYWVDVATFGVALLAVAGLDPLPPGEGSAKFGLSSIAEGFSYLRGRQALQATFVIDLDAMVFGMPRALFPALGLGRFGGGAGVVGLLYAAPGAGALLASLLTGWVGGVRRQGRAVVVAVVVWGLAITAFGFAYWLPLALGFLALAGAADVVSAVFRNTILQLSVPDVLRGRLSAIHIAVVTGGPRLGDTEAGAVAALLGNQVSVISGGLMCVAGALVIGSLMPALARYDAHQHLDGGEDAGAKP
ncbi:MAG: MFS transporter [Acidimicrobiales bacterium]